MDVELALAIFFEYATVHFGMIGKDDHAAMSERWRRLLFPSLMAEDGSEETGFLTADADEDDEDDTDAAADGAGTDAGTDAGVSLGNGAASRVAAVGVVPAAEGGPGLERRIAELRALVGNLHPDSPEAEFRAVAQIAGAAADLAAAGPFVCPPVPAEIASRLAALGLALPEPLPAAAARRLAGAEALAAIDAAEALGLRRGAVEAAIAASQSAILEATAAGRYGDLAGLGAAASDAQVERSAVEMLLEAELGRLRGWLASGESADEPDRRIGPATEAAPEVKSVFPRPAWAGTPVTARTVTPVELPDGTQYRLNPAATAAATGEAADPSTGAPDEAASDEAPWVAPVSEPVADMPAAEAAGLEATGPDGLGDDDEAAVALADAHDATDTASAAPAAPATEGVADIVTDATTAAAAEAWADALDASAQLKPDAEAAGPEEPAATDVAVAATEVAGVSIPGGVAAAADDDATVRLDDHLESRRVTARLFERNLLGIAADMAQAAEAVGRDTPVSADVLKAVAAARAPQRDYGPRTPSASPGWSSGR